MTLLLLTAFIVVPLAELALLIWLGQTIGLWQTIGIVVITAVIGTTLLRSQGLSTLLRAQQAMAEGRVPVESVVEGALLLFAGAFLLTPGLITDTVGFLLLVPPIRQIAARWALQRVFAKANVHVSGFGNPGEGPVGGEPPGHQPEGRRVTDDNVIDAEFERVEDVPPKTRDDDPNAPPKRGWSPWRKGGR